MDAPTVNFAHRHPAQLRRTCWQLGRSPEYCGCGARSTLRTSDGVDMPTSNSIPRPTTTALSSPTCAVPHPPVVELIFSTRVSAPAVCKLGSVKSEAEHLQSARGEISLNISIQYFARVNVRAWATRPSARRCRSPEARRHGARTWGRPLPPGLEACQSLTG